MRTSTQFSALLCAVLAVLWAGCTKSNTSIERGKDMLGGVDMATPDLAGVSNDLAGDLATSAGDLAASDLGSTPVDIGMCTPNAFAYCEVDGRTAVYCNAGGTAGMTFDCGAGGCLGPSGCGQCTADSCVNGINGGSFTPCDTAHQKAGAPVACETLSATGNSTQCASPTACGPQCAGAFVCGDGSSYGTATNSSYACTAGTIGAGTACAFGCDSANGKCKDLVPANDGAGHLGAADTFTCTGTQNAKLAAITGATGDTITFNTSLATVVKTGSAVAIAGVVWGTAYTPATGHTPVITAHIRSLTLTTGAKVVVTGANALILLVDQSVSATGTVTVDLSAHFTRAAPSSPEFPTVAGPGASFANNKGAGGASSAANQSGGGGGGYGVAGGTGGDGNGGTTAVAGGMQYGAAFLLEAGGYGGGASYDNAGKGGGGLQISACGDVSLDASVLVNASGGGGKAGALTVSAGGSGPSPSPTGGWGGGAGGTILIEAATTTTLTGALVANGGGGGEGNYVNSSNPSPADGNDWNPATAYNAPAPGGGVAAAAGSGGAGGAGVSAPGNGGNGLAKNAGGAGGGSYGNVYVGVSPIVAKPTGLITSPTAVVSRTCVTVNGAKPATCTYP